MKKNESNLEIIIVNFNSAFWLKKALTSLKEKYLSHTKNSVVVTVVDNGSEDESISLMKKEFRWVNLIERKDNSGYAAANNIVLQQTNAEFILLLNSDVELTDHSNLDVLITYLQKHEKVGVITPRIEFTDGEIDPACHRGEPTPWVSFTYFTGLAKLFPNSRHFGEYHQSYKDLFSIHPIAACSGAAMLVRKVAIEQVGLLDERFFMYAEDLDWCKRFREAGYEVIYNPEVVVVHHKYKSGIKNASQKIARKTRMHFYDTMLQYYDKHYRSLYPELLRSCIRYFLVIKKGAI